VRSGAGVGVRAEVDGSAPRCGQRREAPAVASPRVGRETLAQLLERGARRAQVHVCAVMDAAAHGARTLALQLGCI
jgi:hypothetical protein